MNNSSSLNQCQICNRKNSQLLVLMCGHDPCIDCAAQHYFNGSEYRTEFQYIKEANYWCEICRQPTVIDAQSVKQLIFYAKDKGGNLAISAAQTVRRSKSYRPRNLSKNSDMFSGGIAGEVQSIRFPGKVVSKQKDRSKNKRSSKQIERYTQLAQSHQIRQPHISPRQQYHNENSQKTNLKSIKSSKNLLPPSPPPPSFHPPCKRHLDEQLSYYCFTCNQSICVQCALHGSHIGHQIQAIRKAGPKLKNLYEAILGEAHKSKLLVQNHVKQIEKAIQGFKKWNQKNMQIIRQKFTQLYELLADRQRKMLTQIEQIQKQGIQYLQSQKYEQQKLLISLKQSRKRLKTNISESSQIWNITQIQKTKQQLKSFCQSEKVMNFDFKNVQKQIKYVQTQLLCQAVDTISQFVNSFKITVIESRDKSGKKGEGKGEARGEARGEGKGKVYPMKLGEDQHIGQASQSFRRKDQSY